MSKLFIPQHQNPRTSIGLLAVRVVAGVALLLHGWDKIQAPMSWIDGAKQTGAVVPGIIETLAPLAAVGEFLGGILLAIGLMTPIATLLLMGTMAGAVYFHWENGDSFIQGWELAAVYFVISLLLFLAGPGGFSLDKMLFKRGQ